MAREDVVICTMEYYSAIKKNEPLPFATAWMDLEAIILNEISQIEKDKYYIISLTCGDKKIKQTTEYKKEADSQMYRDQTSGYQWGEGRGGGSITVGD